MISVVINTLNEQENLPECIESVRGLADEIVVCDMYSEDRTAEIAAELGARVVFYERAETVEAARHFAISQAQHEWILVLDADERMTPELSRRLREIASDNRLDVVLYGSLYLYFGDFVRNGGFFSTDWPRFFKKSAYLSTYTDADLMVHRNFRSLEGSDLRKVRLPSELHMIHLAYPSIEKYVVKTLGRYARIEAEEYFARGRKFSLRRLIAAPLAAFVLRYLLQRGYRDGVRGLILCTLYAVYRFAVWANMWLLEEQMRRATSE